VVVALGLWWVSGVFDGWEGSCCGSDDRCGGFGGLGLLGWVKVEFAAMHVWLHCFWR
jgi:hypothetical protein